MSMPAEKRAKFDRATFWIDVAAREWKFSVSTSFTAFNSAIEALTERGEWRQVKRRNCNKDTEREVPGATERFRSFFATHAPGIALAKRLSDMYSLRSDILHGSKLMQLDQDLISGWDPPQSNERELYEELWSLMRVAVRNWLRNPPV